MPKETFHNLPEKKRDRIISVAGAEFATKPYDVASISDIVRKAGIAKGSFYQYFEDKKDLYQYLIELGNAEKLKLMQELPAPDPDSDLFGYFRWLFQSTVYFEVKKPHLAQIIYRAFVEEVPFPDMAEELRRRGTTQFFKQLISQGILHGEIAMYTDPDIAAFLMETVFYRLGKYLTTRMDLTAIYNNPQGILEDEAVQQVLSNLMDLLQGGMQADPQVRKIYYTKS